MQRPQRTCNKVLPVKGVPRYRKWIEPKEEIEWWLKDAKFHQRCFARRTPQNSTDLLYRVFNFLIHFEKNGSACFKFLDAVYSAAKCPEFRDIIREGICKSGRMKTLVHYLVNKNKGPRNEAKGAMKTGDGIALLTDLATSLVIGHTDDDKLSKEEHQQKLRDGISLIVNYSQPRNKKQAMRLVVNRLKELKYEYMVPELSKAIVSQLIADKYKNPHTPVHQLFEEEAMLALHLSYGKDEDGYIKPLSMQQLEEIILSTSQPFLQAKMALAWLSLCSEDFSVKSNLYAVSMGAISAFEEDWAQYLENCPLSHRTIVQDMIDSTVELVNRVGFKTHYHPDLSTEADFEGKDMYTRRISATMWKKDLSDQNSFDNFGGFLPKFRRVKVRRFVPPETAPSVIQQQLEASAAENTPTPHQSGSKSCRQDVAGPSKKGSKLSKSKNTAKRSLPFPKRSNAAALAATASSSAAGKIHKENDVDPDVPTFELEPFTFAPNVMYNVYTDIEGDVIGPLSFAIVETVHGVSNPAPEFAQLPSFAKLVSSLQPPFQQESDQHNQLDDQVYEMNMDVEPDNEDPAAAYQVFPSDYVSVEYAEAGSGPVMPEVAEARESIFVNGVQYLLPAISLPALNGEIVYVEEPDYAAQQPQLATLPALEAQNLEQYVLVEDGADQDDLSSSEDNEAAESNSEAAAADEGRQAGPSHVDSECANLSLGTKTSQLQTPHSNESQSASLPRKRPRDAAAELEDDEQPSKEKRRLSVNSMQRAAVGGTEPPLNGKDESECLVLQPSSTTQIVGQPAAAPALKTHASVEDTSQASSSQNTASSAVSLAPLVQHATQHQALRDDDKRADESAQNCMVAEAQKENVKPNNGDQVASSTSVRGQNNATKLPFVVQNTQQTNVGQKVINKAGAVLTSKDAGAKVASIQIIDLTLPTGSTANAQQTSARQEILEKAGSVQTSKEAGAKSACMELIDLTTLPSVPTATAQKNQQAKGFWASGKAKLVSWLGIGTKKAHEPSTVPHAATDDLAEDEQEVEEAKGFLASGKAKLVSWLGIGTKKAHEPSPVPHASTDDVAEDEQEVEEDEDGQESDCSITIFETHDLFFVDDLMTDDEDLVPDKYPKIISIYDISEYGDGAGRGDVTQASTQHSASASAPRPKRARARKRRRQQSAPRKPQSSICEEELIEVKDVEPPKAFFALDQDEFEYLKSRFQLATRERETRLSSWDTSSSSEAHAASLSARPSSTASIPQFLTLQLVSRPSRKRPRTELEDADEQPATKKRLNCAN